MSDCYCVSLWLHTIKRCGTSVAFRCTTGLTGTKKNILNVIRCRWVFSLIRFFFAAAALADGEEKKVEAAAEVDGGFRGVELKVVVAFRYSEAIKKHKKMGTMADALLMKCGPPYAEKKPGH